MSEWKAVVGYEDYYEVSNDGRLRRKARVISNGHGPVWLDPKELVGSYSKKGYKTFLLTVNRKQSTLLAHHLVLEAFSGPRPEGCQVRHLDGDRTNNHISNLKWGTSSENNYDRVRHGVHAQARQTHCKRGHEFTDENTRIDKKGRRCCRECARMHSRNYEMRRPKRKRVSGKMVVADV